MIGFRKGFWMQEIHCDIIWALWNNLADIVLLDFSKVYDSISHDWILFIIDKMLGTW